jgi:hypothetical protein
VDGEILRVSDEAEARSVNELPCDGLQGAPGVLLLLRISQRRLGIRGDPAAGRIRSAVAENLEVLKRLLESAS